MGTYSLVYKPASVPVVGLRERVIDRKSNFISLFKRGPV